MDHGRSPVGIAGRGTNRNALVRCTLCEVLLTRKAGAGGSARRHGAAEHGPADPKRYGEPNMSSRPGAPIRF